jgi:hypothetical protein
MRTVRYARSAEAAFQILLAQGAAKFSVDVVDEKRLLLRTCVGNYLAEYPHHGLRTPGKTFRHYPVDNTPYTVVFDYDEVELRELFIVHQSADRRRPEVFDVQW